MRIAVDARPLAGQPTGIGLYLRGLIAALDAIDHENEYILISHRDFSLPSANGRWRKHIVRSPLCLSGSLCVLASFGRAAAAEKADLYWGTMPILPFNAPLKKVVTVHDFVWRHYPQTMTKYNYLVNSFLAERSLRQADRIIAVSRFTAEEVKKLIGDRAKLTVVHNGLDHSFYRPGDRQAAAAGVAARFHVGEKYVLMVGTLEPRKNLLRAIEAFRRAAERDPELQLLIAGGSGWQNIPTEYRDESVSFLGYVSDEELRLLYQGAELLIFPSLYEGFGFPPLQAMACGCPVIASGTSSMPEVCGDAAFYIEPTSIDSMAEAIGLFLKDGDKRAGHIARGFKQAQLFSWEKAARETLEVFKQA